MTKYLFSGNIFQSENEIEKYNSPIEGEMWKPNFKTKLYYTESSCHKRLNREILKWLKRNKKNKGFYNIDITFMEKNNGYGFHDRIRKTFFFDGNNLGLRNEKTL